MNYLSFDFAKSDFAAAMYEELLQSSLSDEALPDPFPLPEDRFSGSAPRPPGSLGKGYKLCFPCSQITLDRLGFFEPPSGRVSEDLDCDFTGAYEEVRRMHYQGLEVRQEESPLR